MAQTLARASGGNPACARLAAPLVSPWHGLARGPVNSPKRVYELAEEQLTGRQRTLLRWLAGLGIPEFGLLTLGWAMTPMGADYSPSETAGELADAGFLHTVGQGRFRISAAVREAHPARSDSSLLLLKGALDQTRRALRTLHGSPEARPEGPEGTLDARDEDSGPVVVPLDDHLDLLARTPTPWPPTAHELCRLLSRYAAFRGDHHRLVALQLLNTRRLAISSRQCPDLYADLARQLGALRPARRVLDQLLPAPHGALERALIQRDSGDLTGVVTTVRVALEGRKSDAPSTGESSGGGRSGKMPDGPTRAALRLVLAEALTDQGRLSDAHAHINEAERLHRKYGGVHGPPMANLLRGRLSLLQLRTRDHLATELLLTTAASILTRLGDTRGAAWAATDLARARPSQDAFDRALAAHRATEDVRGVAWTQYYSALVLADGPGPKHYPPERTATTDGPFADDPFERADRDHRRAAALDRLAHTAVLFARIGDKLGQAWSLHQIGVLHRDGTAGHAPPESDPLPLWDEAYSLFQETGCPHGQAWTALEQGLHVLTRTDQPLFTAASQLNTAAELFQTLDDKQGSAWTAYAQSLLGPDEGEVSRQLLLNALRTGLTAPAFAALMAKLGDLPLTDVHPPPRHLRDVAVTELLVPRPPSTPPETTSGHGCRVLVDLIDEGPGIRLLLRVAPEPGHPWSREESPWLTASAAPQSPMAVEPMSALLRASGSPAQGAEFTLTPLRPGLHRLRFTVAHRSSGAVLQQVETEIELPDLGTDDARHSPTPRHAVR
jgi:hypothetical protein